MVLRHFLVYATTAMERNPEFYPYSTTQTGFNELRKCVITGDLQALRACLALDPSQYHVDFPDYRGNSSLHVAVDMQNVECVRLLLKHKASVRKLGMDEETPLHLAAKRFGPHSEAILTALLEADPGAVRFCDDRCAEKARVALSSGNSSSTSSSSSSSSTKNTVKTPLHVAIKSCNATAVRILLTAGSSVYARFVSRVDQKDEAGDGDGGSGSDEEEDDEEEEQEEQEEEGLTGDRPAQSDTAKPPSATTTAGRGRRFSSSFRVTTVVRLATKYAHVSASDEAASILSLVREHAAAAAAAAAVTEVKASASASAPSAGSSSSSKLKRATPAAAPAATAATAAGEGYEEAEEAGEAKDAQEAEEFVDEGTRAYLDMMRHMWDGDGEARRQAEYEAALLIFPRSGRAAAAGSGSVGM